MITIYQYDSAGMFTGATQEIGERDGCPVGWTREQPIEGECVYQGGRWLPYTPPEFDIVAARAAKQQQISAARYDAEVGGYQWGTLIIDTSRDSRATLAAEYDAAKTGTRPDPALWKCYDAVKGAVVFAAISNNDFVQMAEAVQMYIRLLFEREAIAFDKIERAQTAEELEVIEL